MKKNLRSFVMRHPILLPLRKEVLDPATEPILHATPRRLMWLGIFTLIVHPLFWYMWTTLLPQPYESLTVRILMALTGLGLCIPRSRADVHGIMTQRYFLAISWLQLPVFCTFMYWMNGHNSVWLATMTTMIVGYYHLTDWRLASLGLFCGAITGTLWAFGSMGATASMPTVDAVVLSFAFFAAITLAMSSANLRRERIGHSLAVIGIMAHELRTPLATAALIGQALRTEAQGLGDAEQAKRLVKLAFNLESLTRGINHHIDLQMINARLMQLPQVTQKIFAADLVQSVTDAYPYGSSRERQCVEVIAYQDFVFEASERQFTQVLNNLIKNALHSLNAAQSRHNFGDLRIELGINSGVGRVIISDKGMGIPQENLARIFEPFFSTSDDTGHGLGLAFCKQVVQNAGGFIGVKSQLAFGASFTIDVPATAMIATDTQDYAPSSLPSS
jgi:two-component system, CAI-1 autoinducer sensor kinase/phosphatase CqsS